MAGQAASGYAKRAQAETAISYFERVIGDALCSHTDERRTTEVKVAVHVLIRFPVNGLGTARIPFGSR